MCVRVRVCCMSQFSVLRITKSNKKIVLYRKDRGGGLLTCISLYLSSEFALPAENPVFFVCLFVKINFDENKRLLIGNIYRPPYFPVESIITL